MVDLILASVSISPLAFTGIKQSRENSIPALKTIEALNLGFIKSSINRMGQDKFQLH